MNTSHQWKDETCLLWFFRPPGGVRAGAYAVKRASYGFVFWMKRRRHWLFGLVVCVLAADWWLLERPAVEYILPIMLNTVNYFLLARLPAPPSHPYHL